MLQLVLYLVVFWSTPPDVFDHSFIRSTFNSNCLMPASKLREVGVEIEGREVYELANGQPVEYGFARVEFMGADTVTRIIFGPEEAEPILGVIALEGTGIAVDPVTRTLRKMSAKPLK